MLTHLVHLCVQYDELKTMKETIEKEAEAKKMEEEKKRKAEEKIKSKVMHLGPKPSTLNLKSIELCAT
jgi:L-fucose isomerase-like protein